jgi:hypothetical protein
MPPILRRSAVFLSALLLSAFCAMLGAGSAGALVVKPGHPRIYIHPDSVAVLRARCAGSNSAVFNRYRQFVDESVANPGRLTPYYLQHYAFMYLMTGSQTYGTPAVGIAMRMCRNNQEVTGEGGGPAGISNMVLAYDWAYDAFTQAQRDSIVNKIVANLNHPADGSGHPWLYWDVTWSYAYAIAGDAGANNAAVLAKLQESIDNLNSADDCLDVLAPNGAIDGYSGTRVWKMLSLADCLKLGTDYDPFPGSNYLTNTPHFWLARFRPDLTWTRLPAKYNTTESAPCRLFSFFGSRLGDPYCQSVAKDVVDSGHWLDDDGLLEGPMVLTFYNPGQASSPIANAPTTYWDPGMGFLMCRDAWSLPGTGNDMTLGFFNGPDTQGHLTQNHFSLARGADNLLIDSGLYRGDLNDHYSSYYTRAIAHNTVLVYDPSESFGTYVNDYGETRNVPNDGGQQRSDQAAGNAHWPLCDGTYGYRGEIQQYEENPDYVHLIGDATAAYNPAKVRRVLRRFVYLRPDWVLVQDQIQLARPNLPVRSLFHCVNRPSADVPLERIQGNLATGGVFRAPNARVVTVNNGSSSARIYVVQAEGGTAEVRIVGGQADNGLPWRQDIQSHDALTYDPSRQGYEFWVDGTSTTYPPGGPYLHQSDIDGRNTGPNTAGDWRTEVLVQNAASEVRISCLIQVVPIGTPLAQVTPSVQGDVLSIAVDDGGRSFHLAVCPPGMSCGQMTYTH